MGDNQTHAEMHRLERSGDALPAPTYFVLEDFLGDVIFKNGYPDRPPIFAWLHRRSDLPAFLATLVPTLRGRPIYYDRGDGTYRLEGETVAELMASIERVTKSMPIAAVSTH